MSVYKFTVKDNQGNDVSLARYSGKVLLIVNTATRCGLTPQYDQLEALYKKYHDRGLEILDFPCNQFLGQAPEDDAGIDSFCRLNFGTTFHRFAKIEVNGPGADPLFAYLKNQAPETQDSSAAAFMLKIVSVLQFKGEADIKWNFTKFLVDRTGHVRGRFSPTYKPEDLSEDIEGLLAEGGK